MPTSPIRQSATEKDKMFPTVADFTAFHGMVCNPSSAQFCIEYFDGCALFASQADYSTNGSNISSFDYKRTPIQLNLITYYLLVMFSGTGLLTLLGQTKKALICEENVSSANKADAIVQDDETVACAAVHSQALHNIPGVNCLVIPHKVITYIGERSETLGPARTTTTTTNNYQRAESPCSGGVRLIRRFEFEFGTLLSVMMCHFECNNGRHYLVEVYKFHNQNSLWTFVISSMMAMARSLLHLLQQLISRTDKDK